MVATGPARPRVSRETRLLLGIVLVSLVMLWVLARLRFPEGASATNPVPPLLTQLAPRSTFEDLAFSVSQLGPRLSSSLSVIDVSGPDSTGAESTPRAVAAFRIRQGLAVAALPEGVAESALAPAPGTEVVASDPVTALAVVRLQSEAGTAPDLWTPRIPQQPRYLIATDVSRQGVSLRPAFVGALQPVPSPTWSGTILALPSSTQLPPGAFVFTIDGAWAGLVAEHDGRPAIVPGELVIQMAEWLLSRDKGAAGWLGISVQPLTPAIRTATGAGAGVILTWVDQQGPAAGRLEVTDVIEAVDGDPLTTGEEWRVRAARLRAGDSMTLRVRRRHQVIDVQLAAGPAAASETPLGLTMRAVPRVGIEVLRVQPGSAAARAGFETGDLLTVFGELEAPTPAQASRAFTAAPSGRPLLAAVTRGGTHHVFTLQK